MKTDMKMIMFAIALFLILVGMILLTSCGNMSIGPGNFTYKKVHVDTHHYSGCIDIKKWYDNDTGIEVSTEDYDGIFLSEGSYSLIESTCPFCED